MLKTPRRVGSYEGMACKIPECTRRPRRNFLCDYHSKQFREKTLTLDGERHYKKVIKYSKFTTCKVHNCNRMGRIVKGFCKSHYTSYRRGNTDYDGYPTGRQKRVANYGEFDFCKAQGCSKKPRVKGFCSYHSESIKKGHYDRETGKRLIPKIFKNKGRKCQLKDCLKPAHIKGLCHRHYKRTARGLPFENDYVNKGKQCDYKTCFRPAVTKGFCSRHYHRLMRDRPMDRVFVNKGKPCTNCPDKPAHCKGVCRKCYDALYRTLKKQRTLEHTERNGLGSDDTECGDTCAPGSELARAGR